MSRQPGNGYRNHSNGATPPALALSNGHFSGAQPSPALSNQTKDTGSPLSRAERFEDEKKRIIESCFAKTDETGQLQESYITHIRIIEDGIYPSTPPPPDSAPENKKPRLIIIAVRNTGRVRMHKARENNNGSFSIGKTWNMEELSAIESFSNVHTAPRDDREAQYRTWAGSVGFIATITKPYYWQAGTSKEKDFFIASAVKIYKKYTKGMVPELRGFDDKDKAAILGTAPMQSQTPASSRSGSAASVPAALQPPAAREQPRDNSRFRPSAEPVSREMTSTPPSRLQTVSPAAPRPLQPPTQRSVTPQHTLKPFASSDQMRSPNRDLRSPARPDTSSGPSPMQQFNAIPTAALAAPPAPRTQDRSDSPTIIGRSRSPQRPIQQQEPRQIPPSRHEEPRKLSSEQNGPMSGPALFASSRQRMAQQSPQQSHAQPRQPSLPQQSDKSQTGAPQLPPLSIANSSDSIPLSQRPPFSPERGAKTTTSENSSGLDSSDAAAFGAMTSFWDGASNAAQSRNANVVSPTTPERSRRRPTMETKQSDASVDLRPAPLMSARRAPALDTNPNLLSTRDVSAHPTPLSSTRDTATTPVPLSSARVTPPAQVAPLSSSRSTPPVQSASRNTPPTQPAALARSATPTQPAALARSVTPTQPAALSRPPPVQPAPVAVEEPTKQPEPPREEPAVVKPLSIQAKLDSLSKPTLSHTPATPLDTPTSNGTPVGEEEPETPSEAFRPGLGPMINKKRIAGRLMKAANTANAFKPRKGGVADKILQNKAERDAMSEPDGINAVVPAPKVKAEEPEKVVEPVTQQLSVSKDAEAGATKRKSVSLSDKPQRLSQLSPRLQIEGPAEEQVPQPKVKRRSVQNERYLAELGIDRSLLEGKGVEFENLLDEFGWRDNGLLTKSLAELEAEVKRELGRLEAGSWLSQTDSAREEKVAQVDALLDKVIAECDDMDGLLTLYSVELGSLTDDVAYIEAQSQGLQVQSANQKVLHSELQTLVQTMSLNRTVLEPLRYADLTQPDRLEEVENSLVKLYDALVTIDPTMKATATRPASRMGAGEIELSRMAALREKKEVYVRESAAFCQRLMQQLDFTFTTVLNPVQNTLMRPLSGANGVYRLNKDAFVEARTGLWMYSPVIQFTKEANPPAWQNLIRMYHKRVSPLYGDAFKQNIVGWRRAARKPAAEEAELLFTHQEKETSESTVGGLTSTARKLTVKRSQTLAKTLRNASGGEKFSPTESRNPGALMASEVFAASLDEMAPLISQEQNFFVDMFHATSLDTTDFIDSVMSAPPEERRGTNILQPRPTEPDREMARRVQSVMEEIFGFFTAELSSLLSWTITNDPIQAVGVMTGLSKHSYYLQESSQEFLLGMLDQLISKLRTQWSKFVDEQIHAIEDTKVKIHKRKGVIPFMKTFPPFSAAIENIFSAVAKADYEGPADCAVDVRRMIDGAYAKINRAMFESLKVIAKESPGAVAGPKQGGADDPEDKEMLNYQILIIENMNHYVEEVDDGGREGVLAEWRGRAMLDRLEALEAYIARVIRRPLGKLLEFIESLESLMISNSNAASIASRPTYSRKAARGVLSQYDSKEIRRGVETLRKRIEKHFGDGDEENISRSLITFVNKECERSYEKVMSRVETLISNVYPPVEGEKNVELEFTREDVRTSFRR